MINDFIKEALECVYIQSRPIEDFTIEQLDELAEKAKEKNLLVSISAEHSNLYQGVLVCLVRKDAAERLLKYL